jgi:hypothetical protein
MKIYKFSLLTAAVLLTASSCNDIDEQVPEGGQMTAEQLQEIYSADTTRAEAAFAGMFTMMGQPCYTFGEDDGRADDFGYIAMALSQDLEGPDAISPNSGYNWFSAACSFTSRTATYAIPRLRYSMPYNQIGQANEIITTFGARTGQSDVYKVAQARAIRAFAYMALAPYFQFKYKGHEDELCVPIVTPDTPDPSQNPRATVREVYKLIIDDLTFAIEKLGGYDRKGDKSRIDQQVAYGLRARANLAMENWAEAAADAEKAAAGYTPASVADVSTPSFYNINDANWMWGIDITKASVVDFPYQTSCSWQNSFSSNAYAAAVGVWFMINKMLYDKIPATDVRKGWWVDENLHSPLLATVSWGGVTGDAISTLEIADQKEAFRPYTNVKFGMMSGIGSDVNDNDWPLMRVEEMLLIQAEGYAKSGNSAKATSILNDFVKTYRDPSYDVNGRGLALADEIWFQRRVELWGEGFGLGDCMRLGKPIVRVHGHYDTVTNEDGTTTQKPVIDAPIVAEDANVESAYQFNMAADNPWLLMRFSQAETNANYAIVDNVGGQAPKRYDGIELKDGVTD